MFIYLEVPSNVSTETCLGDTSHQIQWNNVGGDYALGDLINVTDLDSALKAIDQIVKEGEGSSACNPYNFYKDQAQLSHYYLFKCVAEKHQLRVHLDGGHQKVGDGIDSNQVSEKIILKTIE